MDCKFCSDSIEYSVSVAHIERSCKYHRGTGDVYTPSSIAPPGICRELFHSAYPESLAALYSGRPRRFRPRSRGAAIFKSSCPAPDGVTVRVSKHELLPPPVRQLKELAEECAKALFRPFDAHFRRVSIEIEGSASSCPRRYAEGARFDFNTGKHDELCPAGFASIQPFLRICNKRSMERKRPQLLEIHCPDYVGVTYALSCGGTAGAEAFDHGDICAAANREIPSIPAISICPLALQSIIPYLYTLFSGGWFNWVNHGDGVIVHCPSPGGVAFRIKEAEGNFELEIIKARGQCPLNYEPGRMLCVLKDSDTMSLLREYHRNMPMRLPEIVR